MPKGLGKGYNDLTQDDKDKIVGMFNNKISTLQIAKIFPCTRRAVSRVLAEYNIITRRKNRYTLNEGYFDDIDNERKAYFLGLLFADGCVTTTNYLAIQISGEDSFIIDELAKDLEYTGSIYMPKRRDDQQPGRRINFSSDRIIKALNTLGMLPNKILTRSSIPDIESQFIPHFVRGYFDGDGSICHYISSAQHGKYHYKTWTVTIAGPETFLINIKKLLIKEFGCNATVNRHSSKNCYYLTLNDHMSRKSLFKYMYENANIFFPRKKNKWLEYMSDLGEKSSKEKKVN